MKTPPNERPLNIARLKAKLSKMPDPIGPDHLLLLDHLSFFRWYGEAKCSMLDEIWYSDGQVRLTIRFTEQKSTKTTSAYWIIKLQDMKSDDMETLFWCHSSDLEVILFALRRLAL